MIPTVFLNVRYVHVTVFFVLLPRALMLQYIYVGQYIEWLLVSSSSDVTLMMTFCRPCVRYSEEKTAAVFSRDWTWNCWIWTRDFGIQSQEGWTQTQDYRIPYIGTFAGTFADTANVDYRLLFADQGKKTSVFGFQKTNRSLLFLFSACSKQMENGTNGNFRLFAANGKQKWQTSVCFLYIYIYMLPFQTENGSPRYFLNPFTICSSC